MQNIEVYPREVVLAADEERDLAPERPTDELKEGDLALQVHINILKIDELEADLAVEILLKVQLCQVNLLARQVPD